MSNSLHIVGLAIVVYSAANVDDILVLTGCFADPKLRARQVVVGQFIGIAALFTASAAASLLSVIVSPPYLGLMGLAPIALGAVKLGQLWRRKPGQDGTRPSHEEKKKNATGKILTVASVTIANCSDDLGIWTPVLAVHSPGEIALFGAVFTAMTAGWCLAAFWLVHHPKLGIPIRRYAHLVVPFVLVALGLFVLNHAGTIWLIERWARRG